MHIDMGCILTLYLEEIGLCVQGTVNVLTFEVLPSEHGIQFVVSCFGLNVPIYSFSIFREFSGMDVGFQRV